MENSLEEILLKRLEALETSNVASLTELVLLRQELDVLKKDMTVVFERIRVLNDRTIGHVKIGGGR